MATINIWTSHEVMLSLSFVNDYLSGHEWFVVSILNYIFNGSLQLYLKRKQKDISNGLEQHPIPILQPSTIPLQIPFNFEYLTQNVTWKFPTLKLPSCDCQRCTDINTCQCIHNNGLSYMKLNNKYLLKSIINPKSNHPIRIIECNDDCKCVNKQCDDFVTQISDHPIGLNIKLYIQYTNQKSWGVFTQTAITKGEYVLEFVGEIITDKQEKKRRSSYESNGVNYILVINEIKLNSKEVVNKLIIDPYEMGNIGRFINHSCSPNMRPEFVYVGNDIPKICFFATKDIEKNSELTFCYGRIDQNDLNVTKSLTKCYCGSHNCQGYLPHHFNN